MNFREQVFIKKGVVKIDYLINTGVFAYAFVNSTFIIRYKLFKIALFKPCKLRLTDDKLTLDITYMIFIKMMIEDYIKDF